MAGLPTVAKIGCAAVAAAVLAGLLNRGPWRADRTPPADVVFGGPDAPAEEQVTAVAFAPDSRLIATGTRGGRVALRDAAGAVLHTWRIHLEPVNALCFVSDPPALVTATRDGGLRVWALAADGPVLRADARDRGPVLAAAVSPDGTKLAVGSVGRVGLWRVGPDGLTPMADVASACYSINALAFSADGRALAAGNSGDGSVRVWRDGGADEPEFIHASPRFQVRGLRFAAGGALVAADTEGNLARVAAGEHRAVGRLPGPAVRQAVFSADGRRALIAHVDGTGRLTTLPAGIEE